MVSVTRRRSQRLAPVALRGMLLIGGVLGAWAAYDALAPDSAQADVKRPPGMVWERVDRRGPAIDPVVPHRRDAPHRQRVHNPTRDGEVRTATPPKAGKAETARRTRPGHEVRTRSGSAGRTGPSSHARPPRDAVNPRTDPVKPQKEATRSERPEAAPAVTPPYPAAGCATAAPHTGPASTIPATEEATTGPNRNAGDHPPAVGGAHVAPTPGVVTQAGPGSRQQGAISCLLGDSSAFIADQRPSTGPAAASLDRSGGAAGGRPPPPCNPAPTGAAVRLAVAGVGNTDSGSGAARAALADASLCPWAAEFAAAAGFPSAEQHLAGRSPAPGIRPD